MQCGVSGTSQQETDKAGTLGSVMPLEAENYICLLGGKKHLGVLLCSDRDGTSDLEAPSDPADRTAL